MRLDSARSLKQQLIGAVVEPFASDVNRVGSTGARAVAASLNVSGMMGGTSLAIGARPFDTLPQVQRSIALGVAPHGRGFRLAIRIQRAALRGSPMVEHFTRQARGEVDVRIVGRIDKRAKRSAPSTPWYQANTRPLLIGASVGHAKVTAGTIGAFVKRGTATCVLSNNHVLADEDRAKVGDAIIQRGAFDGGRHPKDDVARLRQWVRFRKTAANFVDAALGALDAGIDVDARRLRAIVSGKDRRLAGVGPAFIDEGTVVHKIGRTTGATKGRVTAFDLDNVVVNYDVGNLRFDGQIEIEGSGTSPFSDGGDSGSLIVNAGMEAVALLFAGSESGGRNGMGLTFANPIHRVLQDLNATLLS